MATNTPLTPEEYRAELVARRDASSEVSESVKLYGNSEDVARAEAFTEALALFDRVRFGEVPDIAHAFEKEQAIIAQIPEGQVCERCRDDLKKPIEQCPPAQHIQLDFYSNPGYYCGACDAWLESAMDEQT